MPEGKIAVKWDVSRLPAGLYFLRVSAKGIGVASKKVVVR